MLIFSCVLEKIKMKNLTKITFSKQTNHPQLRYRVGLIKGESWQLHQ